jgi:putative ABC transport system permease protein
VLKAMGFTNQQVLTLVLAESCFLAVLGGGLGLAISWLLVSAGDPTGQLFPIFYFPPERVALGVGFVLALGLIAGLFPALQAMRLRIADALRRM